MTTTADLVLKSGNDVSENLAPKYPSERRTMSLFPLPPRWGGRGVVGVVASGTFLALPAMNGLLPA